MATSSTDDVPAASTEVVIDGLPHRIDWHASPEGGHLAISREPGSGGPPATFAFAVFGGGVVDGHWVSRPAWVRRDDVARAIFTASRALLEPLAAVQGEEPGEHEEAAAIASEVLDDLLGDRRRRA
ncbi:MAG: hypothetical protein M5U28_52340 [Sandaracinaceae bacterium]|nr:hypothetical protein [Sandaracinaceae bacterium]